MKNFFEDVSLSFYPFSSADVITASEIETPPDFLEPFSPDGTNVTKSALPRAARQRTGLLLLFAFLLFSALFSLGFSALPASAEETDYFSTVSVELSENISVRYTLTVPTGAEKLSVRFSFNGKEEIQTADVSGKSEQVVCFDGITPQYLGRELKTTVSFDGGAEQEDTFSVKSYCETLLAACPADYTAEEYAALRRLVCNLLLYGEAAQGYVGLPDPSCAADLTEQERADAFDLLPTSSCVSVTGEEEGLRFYSASLLLGSSVRIKIVFLCTRELTAPSLCLSGADGETDTEISGGEVWTQADGNEWYAYTAVSSPISLLRFSTPFEATVYEGEESLDKTLDYGVSSYVFSKAGERDEGGTPTPTANLAAALYNYGYAAEVFRTTREIVSAVQKEVSAASGGTLKLPQSLPLAGEIVWSAEENGFFDAASGRYSPVLGQKSLVLTAEFSVAGNPCAVNVTVTFVGADDLSGGEIDENAFYTDGDTLLLPTLAGAQGEWTSDSPCVSFSDGKAIVAGVSAFSRATLTYTLFGEKRTYTVTLAPTVSLDSLGGINGSAYFYTQGTVLAQETFSEGDGAFTLRALGENGAYSLSVFRGADDGGVGDTLKVLASFDESAPNVLSVKSAEISAFAEADFTVDYTAYPSVALSCDDDYADFGDEPRLYKIENPFLRAGEGGYFFGASEDGAKNGYNGQTFRFLGANTTEIFSSFALSETPESLQGYTFYAFYTGGSERAFLLGKDAMTVDYETVGRREIEKAIGERVFEAGEEVGTIALPAATAHAESVSYECADGVLNAETGEYARVFEETQVVVTVTFTAGGKEYSFELVFTFTAESAGEYSVGEAIAESQNGAFSVPRLKAFVAGVAPGHGGSLESYPASGLYLTDGEEVIFFSVGTDGAGSRTGAYEFSLNGSPLVAGACILLCGATLDGRVLTADENTTAQTEEGSLTGEVFENALSIDSDQTLAAYMSGFEKGGGGNDGSYRVVRLTGTAENPLYLGAYNQSSTGAYAMTLFYSRDGADTDSTVRADSSYVLSDGAKGYLTGHIYGWRFAVGSEWLGADGEKTPVRGFDHSYAYGAYAYTCPSATKPLGSYPLEGSVCLVFEYAGTSGVYVLHGVLAFGFTLQAVTL